MLSVDRENFERDFSLLVNVLGPDAILRDFPCVKIDLGLPIAPGLRSLARITNGIILIDGNSLGLRALNEIQYGIAEGAIERDEVGRLVAFLRTTGPSRSIQELNDRLGLSRFEMVCSDNQLSTNPEHPSVFTYENQIIFPAGERILNLLTWKHETLPVNVKTDVAASAVGAYQDHVLRGQFSANYSYHPVNLEVSMWGSFEAHLI